MGDAHRRPAVEDLLAVRIRRGRQDRHARPPPPREPEEIGIEIGHRGKEFAGADERHRSGHHPELSKAALPTTRPRICETWIDDLTSALDPRLRPSSDRAPSSSTARSSTGPQADRTAAAGVVVGVLEGQTYVVSGYLATLAALLILPAPLPTTTAGGASTRSGLPGSRRPPRSAGSLPSLEWLVVFRLAQGAAGALLVAGFDRAHHPCLRRRRRAAGHSACGPPPPRR